MKRAIILFWSNSGNTEKVARYIKKGLEDGDMTTSIMRIDSTVNTDLFDYDLVCLGTPSYNWHPPKPVVDFLKRKFNYYKKEGRVKFNAPRAIGKNAFIFCTYSGHHTGIREAEPVGKYIGQFFEHFGFTVVEELYIVSEFHGSEENNTLGRMGNIKGLPNKADLERIKSIAKNLAHSLQ